MTTQRIERPTRRKSSRRRLITALMISAICTSGFAARFQQHQASVDQALKLPTQDHDFGIIVSNSKSRTTFVETNRLTEPLIIDRIDRSCGCTTATCSRSTVIPGQTFEINAELSASDYPESMSSVVSVHGHAGTLPVEAEYHLHANVENLIEFPENPGNCIRLGTWPLSQLPADSTIAVTRGRCPLDFDELRAESDPSLLTVSVEPVTNASWRVHFRVKSNELIGTQGITVLFGFMRQGKILPETVVKQAFVELVGPFTASPSSLLLTAQAGKHVYKTITITNTSHEPEPRVPVITAVDSNSKNMTATLRNDPWQSVVSLDYAAPLREGPDKGEIIVSVLSQGKTYRIKVSYLALIS
jgi:hypothetical protein